MLRRRARRRSAGRTDAAVEARPAASQSAESIVEGVYAALLGRKPDASGLETYGEALRSERMALSDVVSDVARSEEAAAALVVRSADPIIDALYRGILGRTAAPEERAGWRSALEGGLTLDELVDRIENSPEAWRIQLNRIVDARGLQDIFLFEHRRSGRR